MRKVSFILMVSVCFLVACNKESAPVSVPDSSEPREIVIGCDESELDIQTKATAVTSMPGSLYWGATTGTRGNSAEAVKWTAATGTVSSNKINTGKYQTATATSYNYYVSNVTFSVPSTGNVTMTASNTTDIVCGWAAAQTSTTPSVTLNHIFARTGSISASAANGTLSSVSYKIIGQSTINGTAGTYNLSTGAWTAASTKLTSQTAITGSSDMYLIPGTYTLYVTATYTRGDYVVTQTKSGNVTLTAGKINNITVTWPDAGTEIVITNSLTAWSNQAVSVTVS